MNSTLPNRKYNKVDMDRVKTMYCVQHLTLREIADIMNVSHAGIAKALKRLGVTSADGEWVEVVCSACGQNFKKARSVWRKSTKNYCNQACFAKSRETKQLPEAADYIKSLINAERY